MKTCTKCGCTKPRESYAKSRIHKDGVRPNCKSCDAEYYAKNREEKLESVRQYRASKKSEINAARRLKHQPKLAHKQMSVLANHDSHVRVFRKRQCKIRCNDHRLRNKPYYAEAASKRRAVARQAEPLWADAALIKLLYTTRQYMTEQTGFDWHVDHIVPLQGSNVCGLHVHNNLRVVPATVNLQKSNKFSTQE